MTRHTPPLIRADAELRTLITAVAGEIDQSRADVLLARTVWSRLAEPGDAVAGALISALGPVQALDFLVSGAGARSLAAGLNQETLDEAPLSARRITAALKRWLPRLDRAETVQDLTRAAAADLTLLIPEDEGWPERLGDLGVHSPHLLWLRGERKALSAPSLAVVGARACTNYGNQVTADMTAAACAAQFTIVSGAAYGVDAVAHRTALASEAMTVAVLAGGADRPYPMAHDQLLQRISTQGAVCSEVVPGTAPTRWRFLQRNRLIAALSDAILVTEAGMRSGTLNTAGHGAEIGRQLGVVPGPITSVASAGCHRLVKEYGAQLITNGSDLLDLLGHSPLGVFPSEGVLADSGDLENPSRQPSLHVRLLDALPLRGSRSLEHAAKLAGVSTQEARDAFAELELLGNVKRHETPGNAGQSWKLLRRE